MLSATLLDDAFLEIVRDDLPRCSSHRHNVGGCGPGPAVFLVVVTCPECGRRGQATFCRRWLEQRRRTGWECPNGHGWSSGDCDAVYPIGPAA